MHLNLKLYILALFLVNNVSSMNIEYPIDIGKYEGCECVTSVGLKGTCRKVVDCDQRQIQIQRTDLCSFVANIPLYCCASNIQELIEAPWKQTPNSNGQTPEKLVVLRPIEQICEHYYPTIKFDDDDGAVFPAFVGGIKTLVDQQPHMAAIGWSNSDGNVDWRCGGSVVTSNFILTAAHCTSYRNQPPNVARTGDLNLLVTENNTFPEDFEITNIYIHPEYRQNEFYHDIALLKISPDFSKRGLLPACIWSKYEIPEGQLTGMGYGTTEFAGPKSNELFQGYLSPLRSEECEARVPTSSDIPRGIIRQQLCAQDIENKMDTCQGDSGGPLQFTQVERSYTRPMIVGITSFGQNCAGAIPGVYTRVSEYVDWLEMILLSDFHNKTNNMMTT